MFDQLIENWIKRARPVAFATAGEARAWACAIHGELLNIRNLLAADDKEYQRHTVRGNTANTALQNIVEVPADDVWYLESVAVLSAAAAGVFILRDSQNALRYAKSVDAGFALTDSPAFGRFTGGTQLSPSITAGGPAEYTLIFRSEQPKPRAIAIGQYQTPSTLASSPAAADQSQRHASMGIFPGINVTGAARVVHETAETNSVAPI